MTKKEERKSLLKQWKSSRSIREKTLELQRVTPGARIPISPYQRRLWFVQQFFPDNPFYNYSQLWKFKGNLNIEFLQRSFQLLFDSQDVLRSYYPLEGSEPVLKVTDAGEIPFEYFDLTSGQNIGKAEEIDQICKRQAQTRFDLSKPYLLKIALIKQADKHYSLLVTMHHIITDAWSFDILREQLANLYSSMCSGVSTKAPKFDIHYTDYAYWSAQKGIPSAQMDYWRTILSGKVPVLELPFDAKKPVIPKHRGAIDRQELPKELFDRSLQLIKELQVTPFVFFLALYYILLYRYTGQRDISIGTPVSTRDKPNLENLIGFFLNTIVLRARVDPDVSFKEFASSVRQISLSGFSNKDVPFDVLVNQFEKKRSPNIHPFFQAMFLYGEKAKFPFFGPDLELSADHEFDTGVSKFDLTLSIEVDRGKLYSIFEYDSDLFDAASIARMQHQIKLLLEGIVDKPDQRLARIPMLTKHENEILFDCGLKGHGSFEKYHAIHHIIEDMAVRFSEKTAVIFKDQKLSYRELNARAEVLKASVLEFTQGNNEIVTLCLDRSTDMAVGILGILKAGAAYLPLDPEYPAERARFMIEDSRSSLMITSRSKENNWKGPGMECLYLEDLQAVDVSSQEITDPDVKRDDLAYVIYTSGSTGRPKGVPITHANIINSTEGRLDYYREDPSIFYLMSSISFDSSKAGLFWTLCTGNTLVISEKGIEQDIEKLSEYFIQTGVTHTLMLPSLYGSLLDYGKEAALNTLKTVIVAGEACAPSVCKKHFQRNSPAKLFNEYGPTEATVWCAAYQLKAGDEQNAIPIGKPVAKAEIYIISKDLQIMPIGATGEIYIGGPGLSNGYLYNEELTNSAFVELELTDKVRKRLYRTGDLGRYGNDGTLDFLGRADHQVKIRGYRVELEEINRVLGNSSMTKEAVVVVENNEESASGNLFDWDRSDIYSYLTNFLQEDEIDSLVRSVEELNSEEKAYLLEKVKQQDASDV